MDTCCKSTCVATPAQAADPFMGTVHTCSSDFAHSAVVRMTHIIAARRFVLEEPGMRTHPFEQHRSCVVQFYSAADLKWTPFESAAE